MASNAERAARKRDVCKKAGRKPYRGSAEFWPSEHALMCQVAKWIIEQRTGEGAAGDLTKFSDVIAPRVVGSIDLLRNNFHACAERLAACQNEIDRPQLLAEFNKARNDLMGHKEILSEQGN